MYQKSLVALVAACIAAPAIPQEAPLYANIAQIKFVSCDAGMVSGTAFRIGTGAYATANHVTAGRDCEIDGEPSEITYSSAETDLAIIRTRVYGEPLKINCGGYHDGQAVAGIGHAEGLPEQRVIIVMASDELTRRYQWGGFTTLVGRETFIPGMSGGPVLNAAGEVVGMVNGLHKEMPLSFSQSLSETPLCQGSSSARQ